MKCLLGVSNEVSLKASHGTATWWRPCPQQETRASWPILTGFPSSEAPSWPRGEIIWSAHPLSQKYDHQCVSHTSIPEVDGPPNGETGLQKGKELDFGPCRVVSFGSPMFLLFLVLAFPCSSLSPERNISEKTLSGGLGHLAVTLHFQSQGTLTNTCIECHIYVSSSQEHVHRLFWIKWRKISYQTYTLPFPQSHFSLYSNHYWLWPALDLWSSYLKRKVMAKAVTPETREPEQHSLLLFRLIFDRAGS